VRKVVRELLAVSAVATLCRLQVRGIAQRGERGIEHDGVVKRLSAKASTGKGYTFPDENR
jgi:hypothetical protein